MRTWKYTDDIHDYIIIDNVKFRLNTAYDNIFRLIEYSEKNNDIETFMRIIFYPSDHKRIQELTKDWNSAEYISLINYIMDEFVIDKDNQGGKASFNVFKDAELIFASFYYDYGISLIEKKGKMTWKEFIILFSCLSEQSPLGKVIDLMSKPDKELSKEELIAKRKRAKMLNEDIDINKQFDALASFLKAAGKRDKNVSK